MLNNLISLLAQFWVEILLIILSLITIYRKELSSNASHKYPTSHYDEPDVPLSDLSLKIMDEIRVEASTFREFATESISESSTNKLVKETVAEIQTVLSEGSEKLELILTGGNVAEKQSRYNDNEDNDNEGVPKRNISREKHDNASVGSQFHSQEDAKNLPPIFAIPTDCINVILSYLSPHLILEISSTCKLLNFVVNADHIWKLVWCERFREVVEYLDKNERRDDVAKLIAKGMEVGWKRFFFVFSQTWVKWLIKGHCTYDSVLVGIHGGVYDVSNFLEEHPGSPETLLLHGGRDTTFFFEDIGHSDVARNMTKQFMIIQPPGRLDDNLQKPKARRRKNSVLVSANDFLKSGYKRLKNNLLHDANGSFMDDEACNLRVNLFFDLVDFEWKYWEFDHLKEVFIEGKWEGR